MTAPGDGAEDADLVTCAVDPDENVSMAILRAVAAVEDEPIEELPQLYETVDPDALGELVADDRFDGVVEFGYHSYWIRVDGNRRIAISDRPCSS